MYLVTYLVYILIYVHPIMDQKQRFCGLHFENFINYYRGWWYTVGMELVPQIYQIVGKKWTQKSQALITDDSMHEILSTGTTL